LKVYFVSGLFDKLDSLNSGVQGSFGNIITVEQLQD